MQVTDQTPSAVVRWLVPCVVPVLLNDMHEQMTAQCLTSKGGVICSVGPALTGNLEVSVTTLPWFRNVRVRAFESNEEVRDAVLASACIVPPPLYLPKHGWAMDGAFSDFQILKVCLDALSPQSSLMLKDDASWICLGSNMCYAAVTECIYGYRQLLWEATS